jgi:hypothetical protein
MELLSRIPGVLRKNHWKLGENTWCHVRDLNQVPPANDSRALTLRQLGRWSFFWKECHCAENWIKKFSLHVVVIYPSSHGRKWGRFGNEQMAPWRGQHHQYNNIASNLAGREPFRGSAIVTGHEAQHFQITIIWGSAMISAGHEHRRASSPQSL